MRRALKLTGAGDLSEIVKDKSYKVAGTCNIISVYLCIQYPPTSGPDDSMMMSR